MLAIIVPIALVLVSGYFYLKHHDSEASVIKSAPAVSNPPAYLSYPQSAQLPDNGTAIYKPRSPMRDSVLAPTCSRFDHIKNGGTNPQDFEYHPLNEFDLRKHYHLNQMFREAVAREPGNDELLTY